MTGLRVDLATKKIADRLQRVQRNCTANDFRPEVERHVGRVLADCIQATPVRDEALITKNQLVQYHHRIDYIPSFHELLNPTLIVNEVGDTWMFFNDNWYKIHEWKLPPQIYGIAQELIAERTRRLSTSQGDFVNMRKQARFLYQRSWWQVAQSLGVAFAVASAIIDSHTRKVPAKAPPKAFGQWRGGLKVLSVVIFNPFLDQVTKYWKGEGKQIRDRAIAKSEPRFIRDCHAKITREIVAARRT